MPATEYESRSDTVLAWKKAQKLGRFDPSAPSIEEQKIKALEREVEERGTYPAPRPIRSFNAPKQPTRPEDATLILHTVLQAFV